MSDSILTDIKDFIGGAAKEEEVFDSQLIILANMTIDKLRQIGCSIPKDFLIQSEDDTWDDLEIMQPIMESVKSYMCLSTRILFDPPSNSFVLDALQKQLAETEWRIYSEVDYPNKTK